MERTPIHRDPIWPTRLAVALAAFLASFAIATAVGGDRSGFAASTGDALSQLPSWLLTPLITLAQVSLGFLTLAFVGLLVATREWRRTGACVAAGLLTGLGLLVIHSLSADGFIHLGAPDQPVMGTGAEFPSLFGVGVIAAVVLADRPWCGLLQRRVGLGIILLGASARVLVSLTEPFLLLSVVALAWVMARVVTAAAGVPDPRPHPDEVLAVLERFGIDGEEIAPDDSAPIDTFGYFVRGAGTLRFYVKIVHRGGWRSLGLVRLYHSLRFVDPADAQPFRTLAYRVEHEALCNLKAASDGVPTARVAVLTGFGPDAMLLAYEAENVRRLSNIDNEELTDELLYRVWEAVALLRSTRTGHRQLCMSSFVVGEDQDVRIVEFSAAQLGAAPSVLGTDLAELLASLAARVGPEPAVRTAVSVLGVSVVASALPHLQPLALSNQTRHELADGCGIEDLTETVQLAVGVAGDAVRFNRLERIKPSTLAIWATSAIALFALVPQLLGSSDVWSQIADADLWWVLAAAGASVGTYLGAAWAFDGAVPGRLPLWSNLKLQLATSFVGIVTTAASMAISTRYLQRRGIDLATAAAGVALNTAAGVVVHMSMLGAFIWLGGTSEARGLELPSLGTFGIILLVIATVALAIRIVPPTRRFAAERLLPPVKQSIHGLGELIRQPGKMFEVIGGSTAVTFGYILALYASCLAIAPDASSVNLVSIALVYLIGSVIASAAPTPGGLGAVEAALVAGLVAGGLSTSVSLGAVLIYRGVTFWLPILPGWWAFGSLQRHNEL